MLSRKLTRSAGPRSLAGEWSPALRRQAAPGPSHGSPRGGTAAGEEKIGARPG
jgi:hypothetical protein